jgi:hypothetical protein
MTEPSPIKSNRMSKSAFSQYANYYNLTDEEYTTTLTKDIQVCRRCGVIFDLNIRKNKEATVTVRSPCVFIAYPIRKVLFLDVV